MVSIDNMPVKIAITGTSGSGKSMLINTLRGLSPNDVGAAAIGPTETTMEIQRYSHPKKKNLKFYDLTGVGTPNFPKENYLKLVNYQKYDFFIIVSIDEDLVNEKRDHPETFNEEKILQKIKQECLKYIKRVDSTAKVFVISGLLENTRRFDYALMERTLIESFPIYKRQAMIMSMTMTNKEGIKAKVEALRSRVWMIGLLSAGVCTIPVPVFGLSLLIDYILISDTIAEYRDHLGLDDVSLQKLARRQNLSLDESYAKLTGKWMFGLLKNSVKQILFDFSKERTTKTIIEESAQFIPVVG
ncbi:unnamed protein product [Adineta ricciae]|uniref:IRG-type G domain-containing protein n=1 Tax=Adineta ricciae TaxID=249248 RepID=A0A816BYP4_ADIRI|nr:unnamed protein product [Adineta ricciae]